MKRTTRATEAAIRFRGGTVFTGGSHGHALERAAAAGYWDAALDMAELGFSRPDGSRFEQPGLTLVVEAPDG